MINKRHGGSGYKIISLIAALLLISGFDVKQAKIQKCKSDIKLLYITLDLYKLDNFQYPNQQQGLDALVKAPANSKKPGASYLKAQPTDPWGNHYIYKIEGKKITIYSSGANGRDDNGAGDDIK